MKQLLLLAFATILSINCYAITHEKPSEPVVFSIHLSKEKAWQKVMDVFVANSIPIKLMDKSSGLIQSEKLGLGTHYALKGSEDSVSYALCQAIPSGEGSFYLCPQVINGDLQVYVREVDAENVLLSINLMNLAANSYDPMTEKTREFKVETAKHLETAFANYVGSNEKMPNLTFDPPYATYGELPSQIKKRQALEVKTSVTQSENKTGETIGVLALIGIIVGFLLVGIGKEK
jgi:hypothetical protein